MDHLSCDGASEAFAKKHTSGKFERDPHSLDINSDSGAKAWESVTGITSVVEPFSTQNSHGNFLSTAHLLPTNSPTSCKSPRTTRMFVQNERIAVLLLSSITSPRGSKQWLSTLQVYLPPLPHPPLSESFCLIWCVICHTCYLVTWHLGGTLFDLTKVGGSGGCYIRAHARSNWRPTCMRDAIRKGWK